MKALQIQIILLKVITYQAFVMRIRIIAIFPNFEALAYCWRLLTACDTYNTCSMVFTATKLKPGVLLRGAKWRSKLAWKFFIIGKLGIISFQTYSHSSKFQPHNHLNCALCKRKLCFFRKLYNIPYDCLSVSRRCGRRGQKKIGALSLIFLWAFEPHFAIRNCNLQLT